MRNFSAWRLFFIYGLLVILMAVFMPRQLDWRPNFSKDHASPYGSKVVYEMLNDLFKLEIDVSTKPVYNFFQDTSFRKANYIFINSDFYLDSLDLSAILQFVAKGNNALLSAEQYNREFLDSLGLQLGTSFSNLDAIGNQANFTREISVVPADSSFYFKNQWDNSYFEASDSLASQILGLGKNSEGYNFVKVNYGQGSFFLHTFPLALTNYYILKAETSDYLSAVLSQLPADHDVIWDEYYKPLRNASNSSPLGILMRYQAFRWAYWLIISGVLLYLLFYSKRRQRPIPILQPLRNDSLVFAKTLGSLYFNQGSNKDIFNKRIQVFRSKMKDRYLVKDISFKEEDVDLLAKKTSSDKDELSAFFEKVRMLQSKMQISDAELKWIAKKLNDFYQKENSI